MQVRVTAVHEDDTWGDTVTHDNVTSYRHEPDPDLPAVETLVVEVDGDEHRYPLASHWAEILPDPVSEPEPAGDELPDDLGRTPEQVRELYFEAQARADRDTNEAG